MKLTAAPTAAAPLKFGCTVEIDTDGDWVICAPADVTIFSAPGEGVLLGAVSRDAALEEAAAYLSAISDKEAFSAQISGAA